MSFARPFALVRVRERIARATRASSFAILIMTLALSIALPFFQRVVPLLELSLSRDPRARALALEKIASTEAGRGVLLEVIESEADPIVRERAFALAPGGLDAGEIAFLLARRLERASPALEDLRAAGAQGDARALVPLARLVKANATPRRIRWAAYTALAAIAARTGERLDRGTPPSVSILGELSLSLEDDAPEWRVRPLRAWARAVTLDPVEALRARAGLGFDDRESSRTLGVLLLMGDRPSIDLALESEAERERAGLLAPAAELVPRATPARLDALLALRGWGGAGDWRALEAIAAWDGGRASLRRALERARDLDRPATVASLVLLAVIDDDVEARAKLGAIAAGESTLALWARAGRGELALEDPRALEALARSGALEDVPPPVLSRALAKGGARAAEALARAAGDIPGKLSVVLEPGSRTTSERFIRDRAIEASSTRREE